MSCAKSLKTTKETNDDDDDKEVEEEEEKQKSIRSTRQSTKKQDGNIRIRHANAMNSNSIGALALYG